MFWVDGSCFNGVDEWIILLRWSSYISISICVVFGIFFCILFGILFCVIFGILFGVDYCVVVFMWWYLFV